MCKVCLSFLLAFLLVWITQPLKALSKRWFQQEELSRTKKQMPYAAFMQQTALYRPIIRPSMAKIWSQLPTQESIVFPQEPSKITWRDRLAQLSSYIKSKVQATIGTFFTQPAKEEEIALKEQQLKDAREHWHTIMKQYDVELLKKIMGIKTKHQESELDAIKNLLNIYDEITEERVLTDQEKDEVKEATQKSMLFADESEKESITLKEKAILEKIPKPLKGKTEKAKQIIREKKEEKKEKLIHDLLVKAVKKYDLVDYVKSRIIEVLKTTIIPESLYDHIAETLIIEAGKKKNNLESESDLLGSTLASRGYVEEVHEKAKENIEWYIRNVPKEIEKQYPVLGKALQEIEKQYPILAPLQKRMIVSVPNMLEARLMPIIAEELIKQKQLQTQSTISNQ